LARINYGLRTNDAETAISATEPTQSRIQLEALVLAEDNHSNAGPGNNLALEAPAQQSPYMGNRQRAIQILKSCGKFVDNIHEYRAFKHQISEVENARQRFARRTNRIYV
jgi:hypothetical protein